MKRLILFSFIFIISCTKSELVHFHGRISMECNDQPITNASISIVRSYDTGSEQGETIGTVSSDNNGNYLLVADVEQRGLFIAYIILVHADSNSMHPKLDYGRAESQSNGSDIEINYIAKFSKHYSFHVKNTSPFSSADELKYLIVDKGYSWDTLLKNVTGTTVDTIINTTFYEPFGYAYVYEKGGIVNNIDSSLSHSGCSDTLITNIFY